MLKRGAWITFHGRGTISHPTQEAGSNSEFPAFTMAASLLRFPSSYILPFSLIPLNSTTSRFPFSTASASPPKRLGTHNGTFHCDEALGCFMLSLISKFHAPQIIRTRNLQVLDTLDAVLDVGGFYDPTTNRFDHHQKGFDEIVGNGFTTKLSTAGLVYKHYGVEIITKAIQLDEGHPDVHRLFVAVYKNFVEWKLHIFDLEVEMKIDPVLKYVIYQDDRNDKWQVQAVAVSPDKFESRKPLPSHWRGLTDDHLSEVAGIAGCVFVHMSGFICGNKTYEGALAMTRASSLA